MKSTYHYVSNQAGWLIALKHSYDPQNYNPRLKPLAIIPGYGMNAYIFGYHPWDCCMEDYLTQQGFEVWSLNLRNQEPSKRVGGDEEYYLQDILYGDLSIAVDYILDNTQSDRDKVDLIGASLGGAYAYMYAALVDSQKAGSLVGIGAPFRMVGVHPLFLLVTSSPRLLGSIKFKHTRQLARLALPVAIKVPRLIYIYMHPEIVDTTYSEKLLKAVENPNRKLNYQLAHWVKNTDLILNGHNLTREMAKVKNPILCVLSNADGIVSEENALSVLEASSSDVKDYFVAGDDYVKMAHADLFISDYCRTMVFDPLASWLLKQN